MKFEDRYATAMRSSNLKSEEKTMHSSADILGAAGKASKKYPLALALLRLFNGDNHAVSTIIELMTTMAISKAWRKHVEIDRVSASLIARLVLDWYRDSVCKPCGGHGFKRMAAAPALSGQACGECRGTGKRPFETMFPASRLELAKWLAAELEQNTALAGPAAMAALSVRLDL
jgi:hypothetical protein